MVAQGEELAEKTPSWGGEFERVGAEAFCLGFTLSPPYSGAQYIPGMHSWTISRRRGGGGQLCPLRSVRTHHRPNVV